MCKQFKFQESTPLTPAGTIWHSRQRQVLAKPSRYVHPRHCVLSAKYLDSDTGLLYYGYRYYQPGTGRWLSKDPVNELGLKVANRNRKSFNHEEEKNLYAFVGNDGVNRSDTLGLMILLVQGLTTPEKKCGTVISRVIEPDPNPTFWDKIVEAISASLFPHQFVILDDGTRLTHGGTADGENHRTARSEPIFIDSCKSCKEFTQCMKDKWPKDCEYNWQSNNCQDAVRLTVSKCGGRLNKSRFLL